MKNEYEKYKSKNIRILNKFIKNNSTLLNENINFNMSGGNNPIQKYSNNSSESTNFSDSSNSSNLSDSSNIDSLNDSSNDIKNNNSNLLNKSYHDKIVQKYGDFAKMGFKAKTDKVTHHDYFSVYPQYIETYRKLTNKGMLEIGINTGKSLKLWLEYFPNAHIYGIDIGVESEGTRYKVFKCDQSDNSQLEKVKNEIFRNNKDIFFIIDDGSHLPEHQILTFNNYFKTLLIGGGCYIIEDIETSYWTKNDIYGYETRYGYKHPNSLIEIFKCLVDDINSEFLTTENRSKQQSLMENIIPLDVRRLIKTVTFGKNCIVIMKKDNLQQERTYRFSENL